MTADTNTAKKLHIAMVLDVYDYARNGGILSTKRFTELLRKQGHKVTIISSGEEGIDKIALPEYYPPIAKNIMERMKFVFAKPMEEKIREGLKNVDVVHIQFPFYLGKKTIDIAKEMGKPVVATFHVQAEHLLYNVGIHSPRLIDQIYKLFLYMIYNRADTVIAPSIFAEKELKKYRLNVPTAVISNGIPPEYCPKDEFNPADKFTILSVGRLAAEKRQDVIINAVAVSKHRDNIQLILLGEGPKKEYLQKLGKLLPNQPEFNCLPPAGLIKYYNSADLYIHAAEVEVECMAVLEAMGCGLPPLIADSPKSATPQFALDERSLFSCNDSEDLARKIDYWCEHRKELTAARKNYLEFSKQFSIESSLQKLLDVYYKVAIAAETKANIQTN